MIQIINHADCCGCAACANACRNQAIAMRPDDEGFLHPVIDQEKCTECGRCLRSCPILARQKDETQHGPLEVLALRTKDDKVLFASSSGGAFHDVAAEVLRQGGVVVGAAYDEHLNVVHRMIDREQDLPQLMGTKYVQSMMGDIYRQVLDVLTAGERPVFFTGTPCQVDGLRRCLMGRDYPQLLTADVVCHGVPSPMIYRDYLRLAEQKGLRGIASINMRNKKYAGWNPITSWGVKYNDGRYIVDDPRILAWGRIFLSELVSRPSCHHCLYANMKRSGDLSLADYWDRRRRHDELYDWKGTSLVLVNTERGRLWLDKVRSRLIIAKITEEDAMQPALCAPIVPDERRDEFWRDYSAHGFDYCYDKYFKSQPIAKPVSILMHLRRLLAPRPWRFDGFSLWRQYRRWLLAKTGRRASL